MRDASWLKSSAVVVVGLGMTGRACADVLSRLGAEVIVTDTRTELGPLAGAIEQVRKSGARFETPAVAAAAKPRLAVVSPGLNVGHEVIRALRSGGAEVLSEIELASRLAEGMIIAVTGTNGKTTVTGLIGELLGASFDDVRVTGNIGVPLIGSVEGSGPRTVFVTEVSSYQLETCSTFRPRVSVVLNIQDDHLERHGTMEGYAAAKRKIVETQGEGDTAVLNGDDPLVRAMAEHTAADVMLVSTSGEVERGAFLRGGELVARTDAGETVFGSRESLLLKGNHNVFNALAAGLSALTAGVAPEDIKKGLEGFKGYEHRIEHVAVIDGIEYVNDSKGTNPASTLAAIETFASRPTALILGGDDKGLDYSELYGAIKEKIKRVVVLGPGLRRMAGELKAAGFEDVTAAGNMDEAVRQASSKAGPGWVVLLSPASSSFDLFKNFEQRGHAFKDAVEKIRR